MTSNINSHSRTSHIASPAVAPQSSPTTDAAALFHRGMYTYAAKIQESQRTPQVAICQEMLDNMLENEDFQLPSLAGQHGCIVTDPLGRS